MKREGNGPDHALEVLLKVREQLQVDVSENLVKRAYEIERKFQFDDDRSKPQELLKQLIEKHVDKEKPINDLHAETDT